MEYYMSCYKSEARTEKSHNISQFCLWNFFVDIIEGESYSFMKIIFKEGCLRKGTLFVN